MKYLCHILLLLLFCMNLPALAIQNADSVTLRLESLFRQGNMDALIEECTRLSRDSVLPDHLRCRVEHLQISGLMAGRHYSEALDIANDLIERPKPDSLLYWDIHAYIIMNDIFCQLGMLNTARKSIDKAQMRLCDINHSPSDVHDWTLSCFYLASSLLSLSEHDIDGAFRQWRKAEPYNISSERRAVFWGHAGSIYKATGEFEKADSCFLRAIRENVDNPNTLCCLIHCIHWRNHQGLHNEAIDLLEKHNHLLRFASAPGLAQHAYLAIGETLQGIGKADKASVYYHISALIADSLRQADEILYNSLMASNIDPDDYSVLRLNLDKSEQSRAYIVLILSIIGAIALPLATAVSWRRRRKHLCVLESSSHVVRQHAERVAEVSVLAGIVDRQSRELCASSLMTAKLSAGLSEVQKELWHSDKTRDQRLNSIRIAVQESLAAGHGAEMFNYTFSRTVRDFTDKLTALHPDLTKSEVQVASFIYIGMTSKEIAQMTGRSVRTVDSIRYSLRKKLRIDIPTESYLRQISAG